MADEAMTLELLGARLMGLTGEVRDMQQRFDGLEAPLGGWKGVSEQSSGDLLCRKSACRGCCR